MRIFIVFYLLFRSTILPAQNIIIQKLDNDKIPDTITLDRNARVIICVMSSRQFRPVQSEVIAQLNRECTLYHNEKGFDFRNDAERYGYHCFFRYNERTKMPELAEISRYDLGNPSGDGAGKSVFDVSTGTYTGNWNYMMNGGARPFLYRRSAYIWIFRQCRWIVSAVPQLRTIYNAVQRYMKSKKQPSCKRNDSAACRK